MQVEAARRGYRWTDAAGHTVVEPVVPPAALTTIVSMCSGTEAKFGPLRSRLRLLRCYGALHEIAFAGEPSICCLPSVPASRAVCHSGGICTQGSILHGGLLQVEVIFGATLEWRRGLAVA